MKEINLMLSQAVRLNNLVLVQNLLNQRADVNANLLNPSLGSVAPLQVAGRLGYIEMMKLLIDNGADINLSTPEGNTALHYAAAFSYDATALLINKGADLNAFNSWHETPCFWAAQNNQLEILKLLLTKGADGLVGNNELRTPFTQMADQGNIEGMQILFASKADINSIDTDGNSPLSLAIENRNLDVIKWLHHKGVDLSNPNNILSALQNKDFDILLLLCSWGAKLDLQEKTYLLNELNANLNSIINLHDVHILEKISGLMHIIAGGYNLIYHTPQSLEGQKLIRHVVNELFYNIIDLNIDQMKLFISLKGKNIKQSLLSIYQLAYLDQRYEEIKDKIKIYNPEFYSCVVEFMNNVHTTVDPLINDIIADLYINQKTLNKVFKDKKIKDINQKIYLLQTVNQINKEELKTNHPDLHKALRIINPYLQKCIENHQEYKCKSLQYNLVKIGTIGLSQDEYNLTFNILKNLELLKDDLFQHFATEYLCNWSLEQFFDDLKISNLHTEHEPIKSIKIQCELVEDVGKIALEM